MQLNTAFLCSGGGTTAENVIKRALNDELGDIHPSVVIASKSDAEALQKAEDLRIPTEVLKNTKDPLEMLKIIHRYKAKIVSCNGYEPFVPEKVILDFTKEGGLMFNQHPGGVREDGIDFGGKGMCGTPVTAARVLYLLQTEAEGDDIFTESTIQYLDPELDRGDPVGIIQLPFENEVNAYKEQLGLRFGINGMGYLDQIDYSGDDDIVRSLRSLVKEIQDKLLPLEHDNMAEVLHTLGKGEELKVDSNYFENLVPAKFEAILNQSKRRAIQMFPKG